MNDEVVNAEADLWLVRFSEQRNRADAAERRIAAAVALHHREYYYDVDPPSQPHEDNRVYLNFCSCMFPWDTTLDRCTSPTVTALLGDNG